ncbi:hypothetical protein [Epibacterium ulvae]|uniref:hypothetical protein n=1 Tax=Epibacterium ulvae TaxID=1156985 RepID=UPI0024904550|nr:hypothetical protein [Epibacterium ulvae]
MSTITLPDRLSLTEKIIFAIPIFGRIAKEVSYGPEENLYYALATFLCLWGCSALLFGLPGLYLPALGLVPVIWLALLAITRG